MNNNLEKENDKKTTETKNKTESNKSSVSEGTNENSAEEIKANFSEFSNLENLNLYSSNMDFSDIITSSSEYTQSISDANLLLNKISSKLFLSEGLHSTLLSFFEQLKIIILDRDSNVINDDSTVSSECKAILDQTIKLQDENMQLKLALQRFANAFEIYFLNEMGPDAKNISCSLSKDEPASYYINLIDDLIKRLDDINNKKNSCENKDKQKLEKMASALKDLKKKVEKMKKQKYITDAGIKRIERQLAKDSKSALEDNDERYDNIVNAIKELQRKCSKLSKFCRILQSNFIEGNNENEADPAQILKVILELKKENNHLKKENASLKLSTSKIEDKNAVSELSNKINRFENDLNEYHSSISKIEDMIFDQSNPISKQEQLKLEQRFSKIAEKINKLINCNKELTEKQESQKRKIDLLSNENETLNNNNNQIKSILNISDQQTQEDVINRIKSLKSANEKLQEKQQKLVMQTKQVIAQSKEVQNNLKAVKQEKDNLQKKREELKAINLKLEEVVTQNKNNMKLLAKKIQQLKTNAEATKKSFILKVTKKDDQEELKKIQSLPEAFNVFLDKYNQQITDDFYINYEKLLNFFDTKIHALIRQVSSAKSKHENLIQNNSMEKERMTTEIKNLRQIVNNYDDTLTALFPPSFGLKANSDTMSIQNCMEKMKNLTDSIFALIPQIDHPGQNHSIYSLILTLRLILASPRLSPSLTSNISSDIPDGQFGFSEDQIKNALLYRNMDKINRLSEKLYTSLCYNDVIEIIGDMIHEKPKNIDEISIIEMFNLLRQKLEKAEQNNEKFKDYVGMVSVLLSGVASKIPSNLKTLVSQLTTFSV